MIIESDWKIWTDWCAPIKTSNGCYHSKLAWTIQAARVEERLGRVSYLEEIFLTEGFHYLHV